MIYAVSDEGIQALRGMAQAILSARDEVSGHAQKLKAVGDIQGLGPHAESIVSAGEAIERALNSAANPLEEIADALNDVADGYEEIIGNDRIRNMAGGLASAASNKGSSVGTGHFGEIKNIEVNTRLPKEHGRWGGDIGNSKWYPDPSYVPPEKSRNPIKRPYSNPDKLSWGEIFEKYGIDGIEFRNGFPVFDAVSRGIVEIGDFQTGKKKAIDCNFRQADIAMAEKRGCDPGEVTIWREKNHYTWHECEDKHMMQKVPHEVHANVTHAGGRSQ